MIVEKKLLEIETKINAKPLLAITVTILICALILVLRIPGVLTHAQFWAEDGVLWFGQAYNNSYGFWETTIQSYSGTFDIANRLVGYLVVTFIPLRYAPLAFNFVAMSIQLLPVFIINSSRFKHIVRYRLVAIVVSLIYVCITNSSEVFVNLTNIQWHLGVAAFLVLISSKPKNRRWMSFDIAVLAISGLTGPLCLALVVIAFLMWHKSRDNKALINLSVLGITSLYQLSSLLIIQPGQRGGHTDVSFISVIKMISGQIFTGGILGEHNSGYFYGSYLLYVVFAAGLLIIIYALRHAPSWLRYANLYAFLVFIFMLVSLKPIKGVDVWKLLTNEGTGQRYWFIPIFVWLICLLWVAIAAKSLVLRTVCSCLLLIFIFIGVPSSWTIPPRPDQHYSYYISKFNNLPSGQDFKIPINPAPWTINLTKH